MAQHPKPCRDGKGDGLPGHGQGRRGTREGKEGEGRRKRYSTGWPIWSDIWIGLTLMMFHRCSACSANFLSAQAEPGRVWNNHNYSQTNPAIRADALPVINLDVSLRVRVNLRTRTERPSKRCIATSQQCNVTTPSHMRARIPIPVVFSPLSPPPLLTASGAAASHGKVRCQLLA